LTDCSLFCIFNPSHREFLSLINIKYKGGIK
jgi:hypothetical protein